MKTLALILKITLFAAVMAFIGLMNGCTTAPNIGDGKLEPVTRTAVGLAATAAKVAAPEYAGAIDATKDKIVNMGEPEAVAAQMLTDAEYFAAAKRLGFDVTLTYYYKGSPCAAEDVAWEFATKRRHTGADITPPDAAAVEEAVSGESESDIDARFDTVAERLAERAAAKKAK
jgi:hypothetical protein